MVIVESAAIPGHHRGLSILGERGGSVLHHTVDIVLDVIMDNSFLRELIFLVILNVVPHDNDILVPVSPGLFVVNT